MNIIIINKRGCPFETPPSEEPDCRGGRGGKEGGEFMKIEKGGEINEK
jgi:hypothetical protein